MTRSDVMARKLASLAEQLTERGAEDLANEVNSLIAELRETTGTATPGDVLTTGEAARLLGVRSVFTIKRWAREGVLDGYRRGGRILVSRASIERLLHGPTVAKQRAREEALMADLEPFGAADDPVPPSPWPGQKPWESDAPSRT